MVVNSLHDVENADGQQDEDSKRADKHVGNIHCSNTAVYCTFDNGLINTWVPH